MISNILNKLKFKILSQLQIIKLYYLKYLQTIYFNLPCQQIPF